MPNDTWPVKTEEYGSYRWLRREVGGFLRYGYNQNTWDPTQDGFVDSIIQSGVRDFYYPPPVGESQRPHQWTFLTPIDTLPIKNGTSTYDLPADFNGTLGEFTFQSGDTTHRIPVVEETRLRQLPATAAKDGLPAYAAVRPKKTDGGNKQRWEVLFYPTPNAAATLEYRYSVSPDPLSDTNPWPLGGTTYSETILQICLAVAEDRTGGEGVARQRLTDKLAASIQVDMRSLKETDDAGPWPFEDAPASLEVDYHYLQRMVGRFMQFGTHPGQWSHREENEVDEVIRMGLRKFYQPIPIPGEKYAHEWSFLKPLHTLTTEADKHVYDLPEDLADLYGPFTFEPDVAVWYHPIEIISEIQIRHRRQQSEYSGRPRWAAWRPKRTDGTVGTRYEVLFWPVPDQVYQLGYRYKINPDLIGRGKLPLGGQPHSQTILEACLAAAEDFIPSKTKLHDRRFLECLVTSVSHDRMVNAPERLGQDFDPSNPGMNFGTGDSYHEFDENVVTYNGVQY